MTKPIKTELTLQSKVIDREEAEELMIEYYKYRVLDREDDYLLDVLLDGTVPPVPTWSNKELQAGINDVAENMENFWASQRPKFQDIYERISGLKEESSSDDQS